MYVYTYILFLSLKFVYSAHFCPDSSIPSIPEFNVPAGIHDVQGFMQKTLAIAQSSPDSNTKVNITCRTVGVKLYAHYVLYIQSCI